MRTFETLMLMTALAVVVLLSSRVQKKSIFLGCSAALALLFFVHIFVEGARWQFSLAYALIVLLLFLSLKAALGKPQPQKRFSLLLFVFGLLVILPTAFLAIVLPVFKLPAPTGPYTVGTETFHWIDAERPEYYTKNPDDVRELMVQFWYPAAANEALKKATFWGDAGDILGPILAKNEGYPSFIFNHFRLVKTSSLSNASLSPKQTRYPVIIISHGKSGFRAEFTSLAEEFASHGFIAIGIDHSFEAMATVFPDGRVLPFIEKPDEWFTQQFTPDSLIQRDDFRMDAFYQIRLDDVQFAIDELEKFEKKSDSKFHQRIDYDNIGICGHSRGGTTAILACQKDDRLKAGVSLDGTLFGVSFEQSPTRAFMYIKAINPRWRDDSTIIKLFLQSFNNSCRTLKDNCYMVQISGITHSSFSDAIFFTPLKGATSAGRLDQKLSNHLIRKYSLAFFQHYLAHEENVLLKSDFVSNENVKLMTCKKDIQKNY